MKEIATICEFNFKNYNPNDSLDKVSIIVSNEEDIDPHFNIIGENFNCSLCIYKPEYHKDTKNKLNKDQLEIINKILAQNSDTFDIPNYIGIMIIWDGLYNTNYLDYNKYKNTQIDYSKLL